ncbi:hypothetical protein ABZ832_18960 [Streptantibioticus parmotrematis]|uniref:hypothetical protein n=1 Tax=Streptantibioticus parmotrematis TaxID=2873249 RepID=UPI0033E5572D
MPSLDLTPGLITTREKVAEVYGGSVFSGGIVPAKASKKVFVYSDPAVGEKHGYTFDGWAESDEFGLLYLYTGAGGTGDQQLKRGNKVLLDTLDEAWQADGGQVHLFVANGKVPGKAEVSQRYVGQVVLDAAQPYEERKAPGSDDVMRWVFVFRLRPAEGATLALTEADEVPPATQTTVLDLPKATGAPKLPKAPAAPKTPKVAISTGAKDKPTEQHVTAQTVSHHPGGQRAVMRREGQLVAEFEKCLEAAGHEFKSFQITVKGEPGALVPDLYDATENVLYEAKGAATRSNVRMAIGQLLDYRRHIKVPPGLRLAVLLPTPPTADVRDLLAAQNIAMVTQTESGFAGFPVS